MIAVLVGGTGLVGSELTKILSADERVKKIISVSRKPLKLQSQKVSEILIDDLNQLDKFESQLAGDVYFCCLGTTINSAGSKPNFRKIDFDAIVNFGRIAKSQDARSLVVVSAVGASAQSNFFYNRVKGETENALAALRLRSLSLLRPALLVGPRTEFRFGEFVAVQISKPLQLLLPHSVSRRLLSPARTVAEAMLKQAVLAPQGNHIIEAHQITG